MIKKRKRKRKLRPSALLEEAKLDREKRLQKNLSTAAVDRFIPVLEHAINAEREFMAAKRTYDTKLAVCEDELNRWLDSQMGFWTAGKEDLELDAYYAQRNQIRYSELPKKKE
jgi:hypothetical protein